MPEVGPEWTVLRAMCLDKALAANDLPDAWLAAAVRQHGDHLASFDAGLRRLLDRSEFSLLSG